MKTPFAFAAAAAAMIAAIPASAYTAGRPAGADNLDQGYATDAYPGFEELGVKELRQTDALKRLANSEGGIAESLLVANAAWESNTALSKEVAARN